MTDRPARPPLVVHVIDRLSVGGMENGLLNVIAHTPQHRYRHALITLRGIDGFRDRLPPGVPTIDLGKRPGKDAGAYVRLWRALRTLKPAVVHTRNLPTADLPLIGALAGVPARVHGEHGRDAVEEDGANAKYNRLRRLMSPFVDRYITVSKDIEGWLSDRVGIDGGKITQIYNGVDIERFHPAQGRTALPDAPDHFAGPGTVVFGTVGRMQTVKDQVTLAAAFVRLVHETPGGRDRLRLVMVGDGPLRAECEGVLGDGGVRSLAWLPGVRSDVPEMMRAFDVFVLPSRTEGISNTILEAMASGLPVIANAVGGNPELIDDGADGRLCPRPSDPAALAAVMAEYTDPALRAAHGPAARARVERAFSLDAMAEAYCGVYDRVLAARGLAVARAPHPAMR